MIRLYVKEWRNHKGLTQEQLAERLGMESASLSRIERGPSWTSDHLEKIAEALGVEPAALLKPPT